MTLRLTLVFGPKGFSKSYILPFSGGVIKFVFRIAFTNLSCFVVMIVKSNFLGEISLKHSDIQGYTCINQFYKKYAMLCAIHTNLYQVILQIVIDTNINSNTLFNPTQAFKSSAIKSSLVLPKNVTSSSLSVSYCDISWSLYAGDHLFIRFCVFIPPSGYGRKILIIKEFFAFRYGLATLQIITGQFYFF